MSQKRMRIWRHNGLIGSIAMAKRMCINIGRSDSTSEQAKDLADSIWMQLDVLEQDIRSNRIDPED